ncbi:Dol-P-Glc:Glc(2)Man(9)GlcNAc(2)-PP-Dol alpha-1,2-glucosyltransferase [Grifola frondosa]|uniref:Dol-P-Glc:Glc(2)Man(9)GlcNAc(2)-PP-Dol alpha-1,2-glucosyltransferase n=1 Tax=Grifola frondosa TaxID=5627 RepID=A0A1C7MR99_GRIFR|nr:Dol-P-Glc:Glc(2)Man(9)GlcNAc(2)-PP-Dol alpha-1,2-glucosyltransferase [Grifola frondosa]
MLRLTPLLSLAALPVVLTHLLCYHRRERPPQSFLTPTLEAIVLSCFPVAWFFGFLYYTEVPSLVSVVATVVYATQGRHWLAALLGVVSCTFRQNNIIWVMYAYAASQLMYLRFRRAPPNTRPLAKLHDPPALAASPADLVRTILSAPKVLPDILPSFVPYSLVVTAFAAFVVWNGGIVLGDKSNHVPAFHVPQLYYFVGFATAFGWPALLSGEGGIRALARDVWARMFGSKRNILVTSVASAIMCFTIHKFTIQHPFLLSDNRHYTFYIWRRVFLLHPIVPYLLVPGYIACAWAWFLRTGKDQTLLQNLLLPVFVLPTLLPTPLLEPRYFLIPYILLRAQVVDVPLWGVLLEGLCRALADVMHKSDKSDGPREVAADREKGARKIKDMASRRASTINLSQDPPRISANKMTAKKKETVTSLDSKIGPRQTRRMTALKEAEATSSEDQASPSENVVPKPMPSRVTNLRPRSSIASSSLPKYRPRSVIVDAPATKKPPSPARAGVRRPLSCSDDETEEEKPSKSVGIISLNMPSPAEKLGRAISPLPHRAALKVNLTSAINVRPATPETKGKPTGSKSSSSPHHGSSLRASKTMKTSSAASIRSTIPRPPSSSSSGSASKTPRTPNTPTPLANTLKRTPVSQRQKKRADGSPVRITAPRAIPPGSPLGDSTPNKGNNGDTSLAESNTTTPTNVPTIFTEGHSTDSIEAHDVEFMLSTVISPSAPTPALPRLRAVGLRGLDEHTPSRPSFFLPSRANLSYLSPGPPSRDSSSFLRPPARYPGMDRGSILSWEQLAQHSKAVDDEDVENMLSDFPAPFRAGAISPLLHASLDVPDSPSLSAMPSPGGYGSISQVLLPDVTPSPAIHHTTHIFENMVTGSPTPASGNVTMLRLQLAAAESRAQERLTQIQSLESQLHNAKEARLRDAEELAKQISQLEEQVHGNLLVDSQRLEQIAVYEEELRQAHTQREQAVQEATMQAQGAIQAAQATAQGVQGLQSKWEMVAASQLASAAWSGSTTTTISIIMKSYARDFIRSF